MKSIIPIRTIFLFMSIVAFNSCETSSEKVTTAEENVVKANDELDAANEEYLEDMVAYRIESNEKIEDYNRQIADLKKEIKEEKKGNTTEKSATILMLEEKSNTMKAKLDGYTADGKENWNKFKEEFNHDMDEFGAAFTDVTTNNVK